MNILKTITENTTKFITPALQSLDRNQSGILIGVGIVTGVGAAVLACVATTKLEEKVVKPLKDDLQEIDRIVNFECEVELTKKDIVIEKTKAYTKSAVKAVRLYGVPVALGVVSIACILRSHDILSTRNAALASAYATLNTSFSEYRKRVSKRFGEEVEQEIRLNTQTVSGTETYIDENGVEQTRTVDKKVVDTDGADYVFYFTKQTSKAFEVEPSYNLYTVKAVESWANDRLRIERRLFMNDVLDALQMERTQAGQVVGWSLEKDSTGDGHIDLRAEFVNVLNKYTGCFEEVLKMDFNVDGDVWSKMPNK